MGIASQRGLTVDLALGLRISGNDEPEDGCRSGADFLQVWGSGSCEGNTLRADLGLEPFRLRVWDGDRDSETEDLAALTWDNTAGGIGFIATCGGDDDGGEEETPAVPPQQIFPIRRFPDVREERGGQIGLHHQQICPFMLEILGPAGTMRVPPEQGAVHIRQLPDLSKQTCPTCPESGHDHLSARAVTPLHRRTPNPFRASFPQH